MKVENAVEVIHGVDWMNEGIRECVGRERMGRN